MDVQLKGQQPTPDGDIENPLCKISDTARIKVKAVELNGTWYVPASNDLASKLEKEWEKADFDYLAEN